MLPMCYNFLIIPVQLPVVQSVVNILLIIVERWFLLDWYKGESPQMPESVHTIISGKRYNPKVPLNGEHIIENRTFKLLGGLLEFTNPPKNSEYLSPTSSPNSWTE